MGQEPDVLALQEVRASDAQLADVLGAAGFGDWHVAHTEALDKGRAGVAVVSRERPLRVDVAVGPAEFDGCGRWVEVDLPSPVGSVTVASTYVHTGEAETDRQLEKYRFLDAISARLHEWSVQGAYAVVTGDLNVAHREDDLKNWRGNLTKAGFLAAGPLRPLVRKRAVCRRSPRAPRSWAGSLHVVVLAGQGVRQRRRLAHRLPAGQPRPHEAGRPR